MALFFNLPSLRHSEKAGIFRRVSIMPDPVGEDKFFQTGAQMNASIGAIILAVEI